MTTKTATWPIVVGGVYPVKGRAPLHFKVTCIDGDQIFFNHLDETMSEQNREWGGMEMTDRIFRMQALPEDQSPIPTLVEALKDMYFVFAEQERGFDYLLGKHIPTVIANAKAALIKAGVK